MISIDIADRGLLGLAGFGVVGKIGDALVKSGDNLVCKGDGPLIDILGNVLRIGGKVAQFAGNDLVGEFAGGLVMKLGETVNEAGEDMKGSGPVGDLVGTVVADGGAAVTWAGGDKKSWYYNWKFEGKETSSEVWLSNSVLKWFNQWIFEFCLRVYFVQLKNLFANFINLYSIDEEAYFVAGVASFACNFASTDPLSIKFQESIHWSPNIIPDKLGQLEAKL